MTEIPGTDRDQARENVLEETPLAPEDVEGAAGEAASADEATADAVKPAPGSTDFATGTS